MKHDMPSGFSAVVIGGSAGSLDALLTIVERMPPGFPVPLVVVVHTPKDSPSGLVGALAPRSALAVREPEDKEPIAGGVVFVAPSGYHLLVDSGPCFAFSLAPPEKFSQPSIDVLFESAADVFGERLIGIILSGANDDGAAGLAAICRAGGLALVQAPDEAVSAAMPRAALASCPDAEAAEVRVIAEKLVSIVGKSAVQT
jgi:two-component system chemotaxis response regulator CheB